MIQIVIFFFGIITHVSCAFKIGIRDFRTPLHVNRIEITPPETKLSLPHDDTYIVDTDLIFAYTTNDKPKFKTWADEHINLGNKLYFMDISLNEFKGEIPFGFELLRWREGFEVSSKKIDRVCSDIINKVGMKGTRAIKKLQNDVKLISLAGFIAGSSQISNEAVSTLSVVFATANSRFVGAILASQSKRDAIEKIIDDAGLEHLIPIIVVREEDGTFEELL